MATPGQRHSIIKGDVVRQLTRLRNQQFDHIYFDPPYADGLYEPVLTAISSLRLLASDGELAVEYTPDEWTPFTVEGLDLIREKRYGKNPSGVLCPDGKRP